eukprot:scaffold6168_cov420-Prasinococcus_capsulatus_cf.AAC.6
MQYTTAWGIQVLPAHRAAEEPQWLRFKFMSGVLFRSRTTQASRARPLRAHYQCAESAQSPPPDIRDCYRANRPAPRPLRGSPRSGVYDGSSAMRGRSSVAVEFAYR